MKGHAPIMKPVPHPPSENASSFKPNANFNPRDPCLDEFEDDIPFDVDGHIIDAAEDDHGEYIHRRRRFRRQLRAGGVQPQSAEVWQQRWEQRFSCW